MCLCSVVCLTRSLQLQPPCTSQSPRSLLHIVRDWDQAASLVSSTVSSFCTHHVAPPRLHSRALEVGILGRGGGLDGQPRGVYHGVVETRFGMYFYAHYNWNPVIFLTRGAGPHVLFLVDPSSPLLPSLRLAAAENARGDCGSELYWVVD